MRTPRNLAPTWFAIGLVITWSSGFIGAELGTRATGTETLLAWRFGLAGLVAAAWLAWRARRIPPRDVAVHVAIGLLSQVGFVYGVVRAAELGVAAGTSALIAALQPIVATLAATVTLAEKTTWRTWAGLIIGIGGTALVVSADQATTTAPAWAYAIPVAAMLSLVAGTILERRAFRHRPGPRLPDALAVQFVASGTVFTALATATGNLAPVARADFWIAVAWVIVLSSFAAYGCYWAVTATGGVTRVSALLYLTPAATAVWAWAMFGQAMTVLAVAGTLACAAAVALIVIPARTRHPVPATASPGRVGDAGLAAPAPSRRTGGGETPHQHGAAQPAEAGCA